MAKNTVEGYIKWITPVPGDPTYSLLKAHLLFEELLRAYIRRMLPHASALEGARLSFSQILAIAKASSTHATPDHWIWRAINDLNKLRNMLSHETSPKDLALKFEHYKSLVTEGAKVPLPVPGSPELRMQAEQAAAHRFTAIDMVTLGLYYYSAALLGFSVESAFEREEQKTDALREAATSTDLDHGE